MLYAWLGIVISLVHVHNSVFIPSSVVNVWSIFIFALRFLLLLYFYSGGKYYNPDRNIIIEILVYFYTWTCKIVTLYPSAVRIINII